MMKLKFATILSAGFIAITATTALAGGSSPAPTPADAPDREKLSYAVGTRLGIQLLNVKSRVDVPVAIQAVRDVLDGNPTMIQEADLGQILNKGRSSGTNGESADDRKQFSYAGGMRAALMFKRTGFGLESTTVCQAIQDEVDGKSKMTEHDTVLLFKQAAAYSATKKAQDDKAAGEAFLAKNASAPDVKVLPDGLQYRVLQPGTGPMATTNDLIFVKYRGTFINGSEFEHHNHFLTRIYGGIQGWRDVLPLMPVGAEWRIFVPAGLAYGDNGLPSRGIGPNSALIYDLQLVSIAPPGGVYQVSSGMGRGSDIDLDSVSTAPANAK